MTYERYGLSENPFLGSSPEFPLIDRVEVMGRLGDIVSRHVESDSTALLALLGDYGIGKTAVLQNIVSGMSAGTFLPESPKRLRAAYMKALPADTTSKYALYVYRSVVKGIGLESFLSWRERASTGSKELFGTPRALSLGGKDLGVAITGLGTPSRPGDSWTYLQAGKLTASRLDQLSLRSPIDSNEKAQEALMGLLKISKELGEGGILLLIDEWEYLFTATSIAKAVQVHTALKDLYDKIREAQYAGEKLASFVVVIACTPGAWEENIPRYLKGANEPGIEPFSQRIGGEYRIPPLDLDDTRKLVVSRLKARRIREASDPLYPFADDAIRTVYKQSQGSPRKTLDACSFLLEQALLSDVKSINGRFAEDRLSDYAFPLSASQAKLGG